MNLSLSENLPLRTAQMLGDFADAVPLPHRFGDLSEARFKLVRLSDTEFLAADHAMMSVGNVYIDDQRTLGWNAALAVDRTGHTYQQVTLAAAAPAGAIVSATGKGKANPKTGALLDNPGDIIEDLLRLAGRTEDWSALRSDCSNAGIKIAGTIGTLASIRSHIDAICDSVGAIWAPGMGRLYPVLAVSGPVIELDKLVASNLVVGADLQDTADILRISYDDCDATGKGQGFMQLSASPQRFGGVVLELSLPWLRSAANAESVGRRILSRLAGERYTIECDAERTDIRPGSFIRLLDNPEWPLDADPVAMLLSASITPGSSVSQLVSETLVSYPKVRVAAYSVAAPTTTQPGLNVAYENGVATLTITDQNDKGMAGAKVSLDGSEAKRTDASGAVSFSAKTGDHKVAVEAAGFTPLELTITL